MLWYPRFSIVRRANFSGWLFFLFLAGCSGGSSQSDGDNGADGQNLSDTDGNFEGNSDGADSIIEEKNPNTMNLVTFKDAANLGLVCNDGTAAGYYYRQGMEAGAKKWVIHLQGGGMCYDAKSCRDRFNDSTTKDFMSSSPWPGKRPGQGAHSPISTDNPDFYSWNHVYIPYCSSDAWAGDHAGTDSTADDDWHFRGYRIFNAVLKELDEEGLSQAERIILSGSSAGGIGVLIHLDAVAERYPTAVVQGIDDAGWAVDIDPFDPNFVDFTAQAQKMFQMTEGKVDLSCAKANLQKEGICYFGAKITGEITSPLFVQMSQTDPVWLANLGVTLPLDADKNTYIAKFGNVIRDSLQTLSGTFSPLEPGHGLFVNKEFYDGVTINGMTLRKVFGNWAFDRDGIKKAIELPAL